jgi:hypothetical protein
VAGRKKQRKGFAAMDPARVRAITAMGGRAAAARSERPAPAAARATSAAQARSAMRRPMARARRRSTSPALMRPTCRRGVGSPPGGGASPGPVRSTRGLPSWAPPFPHEREQPPCRQTGRAAAERDPFAVGPRVNNPHPDDPGCLNPAA